jgi:hypothetical protein
MKTPSLFAHYWSENETLTTFQEVMNWDINPIIIEIIQTELIHQLNSDFIQHTFPNFNWESNRFTEKWGSAMHSLIINITLPEKIWLDWIQDLTNKTIGTSDEAKSATLEEVYPSFDELLNAEVYYSSPADSLEDMKEEDEVIEMNEEVIINEEEEEEEEEEENEDEGNEEEEENVEGDLTIDQELTSSNDNVSIEIDSILFAEAIEDNVDEKDQEIVQENIDIEFSVLNLEIGPKAPAEKKILDLLGDSPEEKVFETLQTNQDNSLKDRIHTEMTSSLAETLPLFQKINFIQNLFDGEPTYLDQVIQFIDHEANKSTDWKSVIQTKYAAFQRVDNQELWNELYELIERKFS